MVFEFPALPIGAPRRVIREPEISDVEEEFEICNLNSAICNLKSEIWNLESEICNLKSEVKTWASSDHQEHLYVVTNK